MLEQQAPYFITFQPMVQNSYILPDEPGIYLITAKNVSCLPEQMRFLTYSYFSEQPIIYIGISNKSLRQRDYRNHFAGSARNSTLRKSLGNLFFEKVHRYYYSDGKYSFSEEKEYDLSCWMKKNLILHYCTNYQQLERDIIQAYNPPLNIAMNSNQNNSDFRYYLKCVRK